MALTYDDDQVALQESVAELAKRYGSRHDLRDWANTPEHDAQVREAVIEPLGLMTMALPASVGGDDARLVDLAAALEQASAALVPGSGSPALAAIAGLVFGVRGDDANTAAKSLAASGLGASAFQDLRAGATIRATASPEGHHTVEGTAVTVDGGQLASHLVCVAETDSGSEVFVIDLQQGEVKRTTLQCLDPSRNVADLRLSGARATRVSHGTEEAARFQALVALLAAVECVGTMDTLLKSATTYAIERYQFGRQIGSYQAVKHRLADMLVEVELARACVMGAVEAVDQPSFVAAASSAKSVASDTARYLAQEAIGVFGGIGYTWEHDAHLFFRRLHYLALAHGSAAYHRDVVIDHLADHHAYETGDRP